MKTNVPIYVASRASVPLRVAMWRYLRSAHNWNIVASWIDRADPGVIDDFTELWSTIHEEIKKSNGLILYAKPEDFPLKGAYIEVGIALGLNKGVAVVLPDVKLEERSMRPVGSWLAHPGVEQFPTVHEAYKAFNRGSF
jgi:hypothetical protein